MINFRNSLMAVAAATAFTVAAASAQAQTVNVGAAANVGGLIVFVAQAKGFFAKNGVNAKVVTRNTGPALTKSLKAGEIDFAPAAFTNLPAALERGIKVRAIVGYTGGSYTKPTSDDFVGMAARAGSGIKKITDIKGKKVGITFGSTGDLWLRTILEANGIKTGDYKRINTRPPSLVSVLDTGGVDAIVAWEPNLTRSLDKVKGATLVARGGDHVCFCAGLHGTPEKVYKDRKFTQGIVDAMAESAWYIRQAKNIDEVAKIGSRFVRGMTADLVKRTMKHIVYDVRMGENTKKAWNFSVKQLIAQKKMKRPFDPDKYFDFSFINATMKNHPEWFADLK
ncbi:MAG: ABC transporter substrate-binding protein [Rhodospirillales bacterium]|jgi:ABC-type nitrate/sulfonate/bicarbonate transport system substrate-binding protein